MAPSNKVIITCAVTGAIHTPSMSPYLPVTADEIAEAAIGAAEAGAAIVHLHARDETTGRPDQSPEAFARFLPRIKQSTKAVVNLTTGGAPYMTVQERVKPAETFKPEVASLNMGSMNFGLFPMLNRFKAFKHDWEPQALDNSRDLVFRNTYCCSRKPISRVCRCLRNRRYVGLATERPRPSIICRAARTCSGVDEKLDTKHVWNLRRPALVGGARAHRLARVHPDPRFARVGIGEFAAGCAHKVERIEAVSVAKLDEGIWSVSVYERKLARFAPDGELDRVVGLPVESTTSLSFGGPGLDVAYVTSMARAVKGVSPKEREAGALFAVHGLGVRGLPEPRFAG